MPTRVAIRTDSSLHIGAGHVMRCLALARGLRARQIDVRFICRRLMGSIGHIVERYGIGVDWLPAPVEETASTGRLDCMRDSDETISSVCSSNPDWLIVDHYGIGAEWESRLRPYAGRILVIDDLMNRRHDCDVLLDQNLRMGPDVPYSELVPGKCERLLGPKFALLRSEFSEARQHLTPRSGRIKRILVSFGGTDPTGETLKALKSVLSLPSGAVITDVLVGETNPRVDEIRRICGQHADVNFHVQVEDVPGLMAAADLAIGAGGTTTWERCCLGLPGLLVSVADNQETPTRSLAQCGAVLYAGRAAETSSECLSHCLETLFRAPELVSLMSRAACSLVDGKGVDRVIRVLCPGSLKIRTANEGDCRVCYEWRNAPINRKYAFNSAAVDFETHAAWFSAALRNPDRILLIAESDDSPIGVVRYDVQGASALVSIYLVPGQHGSGWGAVMLRESAAWLHRHRPGIRYITAEILCENVASEKAVVAAGYERFVSTFRKALSD